MSDFNRRSVLKAGLGGAALLAGPGIVPVRAAEWTNVPEPNASIRVLRWKQFIQAEFDKFAEQTKKLIRGVCLTEPIIIYPPAGRKDFGEATADEIRAMKLV